MELSVSKNQLLDKLLAGNHKACSQLVNKLLDNDIPVKQIYEDYLKAALYEIGELWERNEISVATEHLASAIVESIINQIYLKEKTTGRKNKTVVVTCLENEYHQIGARMVSDLFEMNGWEVLFLGANTPKKDLVNYVRMTHPNLVAISTSIYFHLPTLENTLSMIKNEFPEIKVLIGGQAFLRGGKEVISKYPNVYYLPDLNSVETYLNEPTK